MNKQEYSNFINNLNSPEFRNFQHELPKVYNYLTQQNSVETIALIENSGLFEKFLWPGFNENSPFEQLFLIINIINYKVNQKINVWEHLRSNVEKFNLLFEQVTNIDILKLQSYERPVYIKFLIICFQNFEEKFIQNLCFKLVSMALWLRLSKDSIKKLLLQYMSKEYINKWRKISEVAKEIYNSKPCVFMHNLVDSFLMILENDSLENFENVFFYEKFIEFMIDLLSQIPTRRFFLPILREKHFLERCCISGISKIKKGSRLFKIGILFNKMIETLKFYIFFEINEENGESLNQHQILLNHYENINKMQAIAYEFFPEKLSRVLLKNVSMIDNRNNIKEMLDELSEEEVYFFAKKLKLLNFPQSFYSKDLIYEVFIQQFIRKESMIDTINKISLYPTEKLIWDNHLIPDEFSTGDKVLPIPKLNLQFLTYYDYFLKNFNLYRYESTFEIRNELEDIIERVHTKFDKKGMFERFDGWSRMAVPIRLLKFLSVKPAEIGKLHPCEVIAEIEINLNGVQQQIKNEWDELKKYDILFLIFFQNKRSNEDFEDYTDIVKHVRGAEIIKILDEENNEITEYDNMNKKKPCGNKRRIQVNMDPIQYKEDIENKEFNIENVYSGFQLLVRRKPKENNFKAILETIRDLMNTNVKIPSWLENVILGYGDNKSTSNINNVDFTQLDLKDTFIDMDHFEKTLLNNKNLDEKYKEIRPPSYLTNLNEQIFCFNIADIEIIKHNNTNKLKKNKIRFTENQVRSILSGLNNGLSLIIGPPGTGKTDVAVKFS
jgi:intron-binding protein aquarius